MICPFSEVRTPCPANESQVCYGLCAVPSRVPYRGQQEPALPGALDKDACEASKTEIRGLPDGKFHCLSACARRGPRSKLMLPTPAL